MVKTIILTLVALLGCAIVDAQYTVKSGPFRLILRSTNSTLDGTMLLACHQGAAIEGLCTSTLKESEPATWGTTYNHNVSIYPPATFNDRPGILYWMLSTSPGFEYPSAMYLSTDVTSNVAVPIFSIGNSTFTAVHFTEGGAMYMPMWVDDTRSPPVYLHEAQKVENWYVCLTQHGYLRETLVWKTGITGAPQNPTCQKVQVQRVFA